MILARAPLQPGDAGTAQTIGAMRRLAVVGAPWMARHLPSGLDPAGLREWVSARIAFEPDPDDAELVRAPWRALSDGVGDCDDIATLCASAALARGWPARYVTVGEHAYSHVYAEARAGGRWHDYDLARDVDPRLPPGGHLPRRRIWPIGAPPTSLGALTMPPEVSQSREDWLRAAVDFIGDLFGRSCAERDPLTWAEHYATRCLRGRRWDGQPCPGTPDPRRLADAVRADPATAETIRANLARWNEGWAPTVDEMAEPTWAVLWSFAVAGGIDCHNSVDPAYPSEVWSWAESVTPGWQPPPGAGPGAPAGYDSDVVHDLYDTALRWGRDRAEAVLAALADDLYGRVPAAYRDAIEQGVRDRIAERAGNAVAAGVPWLIGAGLLLALPRMIKK